MIDLESGGYGGPDCASETGQSSVIKPQCQSEVTSEDEGGAQMSMNAIIVF